jgi:CRP-like cAMP-binding protein
MRRRGPITEDEEAAITAALTRYSHASAVARESHGAWSYSTVWRVAERAGIELTAGRETMGRKRVSPEQRAAVMEMERANPRATQAEIARAVGLSRPSVSRIVPRRRRPRQRGSSPSGAAAFRLAAAPDTRVGP